MVHKTLAGLFLLALSLNVMAQDSLPTDIADFYKAKNFVNAFSTHSERVALVSKTKPADLPLKYQTQRLKKISRLLDQIGTRILRFQTNIPGSADSHYYQTAPGLLKIVQWSGNESVIQVKMNLYHLDTYANLKLVAAYEDSDQSFDQAEKLSQYTSNLNRQSTEIHHWKLTDNGWMKEELNGVY